MNRKKTFKERVRNLFIGKRSFPKRFMISILPCMSVCFILFFFGPLDLSYSSRNYVSYSALDILPATALVFLGISIILTLIISIPGGIIHAFLVSAVTGASIACYLQGAFLNPNLGTLDGHTENWTALSRTMILNIFIWFLILIIPFIVHYFSRKVWRRFCVVISAVLILMQTVSLTSKMIDQAKADAEKGSNYYVSSENMLKLGKKNNVVVFIIDSVSNTDIAETIAEYGDVLEPYNDFIRFDNANSRYLYTVPSVVDLLTGYDPELTAFNYKDHITNAWNNNIAKSFYSALQKNKYEINLFALAKEIINNPGDLHKIAANYKESGDDAEIDRDSYKSLIKLSFYRYFPVIAKPFFVIYTTDINQVVKTSRSEMKDQWDFLSKFQNEKLSFSQSDNLFNFIYLQGSHEPYTVDENGLRDKNRETSSSAQTAGFLHIIAEYMNQMKELGVYDQSIIIILADHGKWNIDPQPVFWIKTADAHHQTMINNHAPITTQAQMLPTIASLLGFDNTYYGETVFDISEDAVIERSTMRYVKYEGFPDGPGSRGWNALVEYFYTGGIQELEESMKNSESKREYHPLELSFYGF